MFSATQQLIQGISSILEHAREAEIRVLPNLLEEDPRPPLSSGSLYSRLEIGQIIGGKLLHAACEIVAVSLA